MTTAAATQARVELSAQDALTVIGQIPIVVRLHPSDVVGEEDPAPLTFFLPRTTLLIAILQNVICHFARYIVVSDARTGQTQIWFGVKMYGYQRLDSLAPRWHGSNDTQNASSSPSMTNTKEEGVTTTETNRAAATMPSHQEDAHSGDYPVSWLLPVGAIKDASVEAHRCASWLHTHAPSSPSSSSSPLLDARAAEVHTPDALQSRKIDAWHSYAPPHSSASEVFDAFPLILYFHVHHCRTPRDINPCLPCHLSVSGLRSGRYAADETRRLHKRAYAALYGGADYYTKMTLEARAVLSSTSQLGVCTAFEEDEEDEEEAAETRRRRDNVTQGEGANDADVSTTRVREMRYTTRSVVTHDALERALNAYHMLFHAFDRARQIGRQKNTYVAFCFPLDIYVNAIIQCNAPASHQMAALAMTEATTALQPTAARQHAGTETMTTTVKQHKKRSKGAPSASEPIPDVQAAISQLSVSRVWPSPSLFDYFLVPLAPRRSLTVAPTAATAGSNANTTTTAAAAAVSCARRMDTFGSLLFHLFREPALARQRIFTESSSSSSPPPAPSTMMDALLDALSPFYTSSTAETAAASDMDLCDAFCRAYEAAPRGLSLARALPMIKTTTIFDAEGTNESTSSHSQKAFSSSSSSAAAPLSIAQRVSATCRVVFVVQGTCPLLLTPVFFMEEYMTSADRTLYVTARAVMDSAE